MWAISCKIVAILIPTMIHCLQKSKVALWNEESGEIEREISNFAEKGSFFRLLCFIANIREKSNIVKKKAVEVSFRPLPGCF